MTRRTSRELLIAAGMLGVAFVALTLYVRYGGRIPGDARAIEYVRTRGIPPEEVGGFEAFFSGMASPWVAGLTTLAALIIIWQHRGGRDAVALLVAAAIVIAEQPLADWIGHTQAAIEVGVPAGGYPSGHAVFGAAVLGMIAVQGGIEVRAVASFCILALAVTRVTSGAHVFDEVLGGLLMGFAWLCLVLAVSRRRR